MTETPDEYYSNLSNAYIENLKKEFYARYSNEGAYDLIEKAFTLGWEVGYDEAKSKFTDIFITMNMGKPKIIEAFQNEKENQK